MKTIRQLSTIFLLFCVATSFAQPRGKFKQKMEQVKALKVAFITNELQLTPEEAAKFWPLYNAFDEKQRQIRWEKVDVLLASGTGKDATGKMSEKEAETLLAQMEDNEEQLFLLRKKFIASLKGVLPATKIIKLKKAEDDFNKKLLQQYREKRGEIMKKYLKEVNHFLFFIPL